MPSARHASACDTPRVNTMCGTLESILNRMIASINLNLLAAVRWVEREFPEDSLSSNVENNYIGIDFCLTQNNCSVNSASSIERGRPAAHAHGLKPEVLLTHQTLTPRTLPTPPSQPEEASHQILPNGKKKPAEPPRLLFGIHR
ncbi:hypothetical protein EVAR_65436_1 [Eumeta japonica]|uniref:Uncharacterized protein n=1 Tax=Eumeta variegata TaxID=151549 RepID=A0A4C1ZDM1_EUMVA|nr:hypothetical protein EVAR_65436_1 [Eumeta japonica]